MNFFVFLWTSVVLLCTAKQVRIWRDYSRKSLQRRKVCHNDHGDIGLPRGVQNIPLPDMYGKNLVFKTGGVDGCDCDEILSLIAEGKIDTTPLITHRFALKDIEKAYDIFENKLDGVIKIAIVNE